MNEMESSKSITVSNYVSEELSESDNLLVVLEYLHKVSEREKYLCERAERENELEILFKNAATKTALEDINLQEKAVKGRYVNLLKRLSVNSANICQEAISARDLYNRKAREFNETSKKLRQIEITPNVVNAFDYFRTKTFGCRNGTPLPIFLTKPDLENTEKYKQILDSFKNQI